MKGYLLLILCSLNDMRAEIFPQLPTKFSYVIGINQKILARYLVGYLGEKEKVAKSKGKFPMGAQ